MKKMLTHTPRKKNERNSQKRTKNTKLEIFSRHFAKKKLVRFLEVVLFFFFVRGV